MSVALRNIEAVLKEFGLSHHLCIQELSDGKLYKLILTFLNTDSLKQHSFKDLLKRKTEIYYFPICRSDQLSLYKYALELEYNLDM